MEIQRKELSNDFVLVIDSTGIKLTNRGKWLKKYKKLHVAMKLKTYQVIDKKIPEEKNAQVEIELVKDSYRILQENGNRIVKVLKDMGYLRNI